MKRRTGPAYAIRRDPAADPEDRERSYAAADAAAYDAAAERLWQSKRLLAYLEDK